MNEESRDRLTPNDAAKVAAQLPTSLKMLWMSFDRPHREVHRIHEPQFLHDVMRMAALDTIDDAERAVVAVFGALQEALESPSGTKGTAGHVMSQLPCDLKQLWLAVSSEL